MTIADMSSRRSVNSTARELSEEGLANSGLEVRPPGTLLYSMYASLGLASVLAVPAVHNQALLALYPDPGRVETRFLHYWLDHLRPRIAENARSNTQANLNAQTVLELPIVLPPVEVQRRIADHLDTETARIDTLITKNEQAAALVHERFHRFVVASVVGDGRDDPQGEVPWAGASAYPVGTYALYGRTGSGHTPSRSVEAYWEDCTIPWVTTGDVGRLRSGFAEHIEDTAHKISRLGLANSAATIHPAGTVVLSRTASVGFVGIMSQPMATSQDFFTWTPDDRLSSEYLLWSLRAMKFAGHFDRLMFGSTHKTIYVPDLLPLRGPVPEPARQLEIVRDIRQSRDITQQTLAKLWDQRDLLRERRQALITAAVTGEIEV